MNRVRAPTFELGQQAGERLKAAFLDRRDIETSAIEWYRGFCRGLGGNPLPEVERFIIDQCQHIGDERRANRIRTELAILDVLARSPLELLPSFEADSTRRPCHEKEANRKTKEAARARHR